MGTSKQNLCKVNPCACLVKVKAASHPSLPPSWKTGPKTDGAEHVSFREVKVLIPEQGRISTLWVYFDLNSCSNFRQWADRYGLIIHGCS